MGWESVKEGGVMRTGEGRECHGQGTKGSERSGWDDIISWMMYVRADISTNTYVHTKRSREKYSYSFPTLKVSGKLTSSTNVKQKSSF